MSQSGFEMFSNVAGMVIVIADVIFFYALWNIFCKNKKEKMSMMIGSVLLLLNIALRETGIYSYFVLWTAFFQFVSCQ